MSSLGSQVSWLPARFDTCEAHGERGGEGWKGEAEYFSLSPLGWLVQHWFASFLTQAPTAQTTSSTFSQMTPDPGPRNTPPAVAKLGITSLPLFAS